VLEVPLKTGTRSGAIMRIAIISIFPPRHVVHAQAGGVAFYTHYLAHSFSPSASDTIVVLCNKINGAVEDYQEGNIRVVRCFDKTPLYVFQLAKQLRRFQPDCVHIQQELSLYGNVVTAWLLQFVVRFAGYLGSRTVLTLHAAVPLSCVNKNFVRENFSRAPPWIAKFALRLIYKPLCKNARHIIVHEHYFKTVLISDYLADTDRISVVPIGIQEMKCEPRLVARNKLRLPQDAKIVLFMGYATGYKGIDLLLEGFSEFVKEDPAAYLIVAAGKHPKLANDPRYLRDYKRLQEKALNLLPSERYCWYGFIDESEFKDVFGACDVVIFPYTVAMSSSGPMALAIGCRRPILASAALRELLPSPELSFDQNPRALASKLGAFFKNPRRHADKLENLIVERSWTNVGQATKVIYQGRVAEKSIKVASDGG